MKIKATYLFLFAMVCGLFSSCMNGDWDEPDFTDGAPFGNNSLTEHNVITIAELIKKYPTSLLPLIRTSRLTRIS